MIMKPNYRAQSCSPISREFEQKERSLWQLRGHREEIDHVRVALIGLKNYKHNHFFIKYAFTLVAIFL